MGEGRGQGSMREEREGDREGEDSCSIAAILC